jgi:hypothetical protein
MGKAQRDKGATFEREVANLLTDIIGTKVKRNLSQTRGGANEGSDITVGPFSIECKRRASIAIYDWLDQAIRDAKHLTPVVVARGDGKEAIAILRLKDFIPLMQGELIGELLK